MMKGFDLCVYVSDIDLLENLDKTLEIIELPDTLQAINFLDYNCRENQISLNIINDYYYKYFGKDYKTNIERVYFGVEVCERLIPDLENVKKALEICEKREMGFTFVTPYVGPLGIEKLRIIFDYLNEKEDIEIVINDFGVLNLIIEHFPNLNVVFGRLLNKLKRDIRFSVSGYEIEDKYFKNAKKILDNQHKTLQSSSFEVNIYKDFLRKSGVKRVGVDSVPQGININNWSFPVDLYWPWTYITSGRNCNIAGHIQSRKTAHSTDEPCFYQCKLYEFVFKSDKRMLDSVQRGTALWMTTSSLYKELFKLKIDRLIYLPYIPI